MSINYKKKLSQKRRPIFASKNEAIDCIIGRVTHRSEIERKFSN